MTGSAAIAEFAVRMVLLAGLVGHKALWEALKRRGESDSVSNQAPLPLKTRLIKLVKLSILLGIVAQTLIPDGWLPGWYFLTSKYEWPVQLAGLALFLAGLTVAVLGRLQLGNNWSDIETATVLNEQRVVRNGLYRYIRHPIYSGDLLLLLGLELALNSVLVLGVVVLAPVVLAQAMREEQMLIRTLPGYDEYCRTTRRFVPFVV